MEPGQSWRCVLFADVAGSTGLYERLGDQNALRAVELCLKAAAKAVGLYHGVVVKTIGDEIMVVFPAASDGLLAACEIQQRINALPTIAGQVLAIRIGCHWGPVIEEANDVFGDTVNTAARLAELAKAGQIMTSAEALAAMPEALRPFSRVLPATTVRGRSEPVAVVELFGQKDDGLTLLPSRVGNSPVSRRRLQVLHRGKEWWLDASHPALSLGRDTASDVVISDGGASRSHGRIELRQVNFVLVDKSTNGTYVTLREGGSVGGSVRNSFLLRHEETILRGQGYLSFGQPWQADGVEVVEFCVQE